LAFRWKTPSAETLSEELPTPDPVIDRASIPDGLLVVETGQLVTSTIFTGGPVARGAAA
jgi:hypothetical protein